MRKVYVYVFMCELGDATAVMLPVGIVGVIAASSPTAKHEFIFHVRRRQLHNAPTTAVDPRSAGYVQPPTYRNVKIASMCIPDDSDS